MPNGPSIPRPVRALLGILCFPIVAPARAQQPVGQSSRLRLVVEAHQLGPVGYRDPVSAMSPDGQWLAYASEGRLQLTHVAGGAVRVLGTAGRGSAIAWQPDSRHLAALQFDSTGASAWWRIDIASSDRTRLWTGLFPGAAPNGGVNRAAPAAIDPNRFREVAWSRDGGRLAGVLPQPRGAVLWTGRPDGSDGHVDAVGERVASLAWLPNGKTLACLIASQGKQYLSMPCGARPAAQNATEAYGSIAFSPDGSKIYYGAPNARGTLDLWVRPVAGGTATLLTSFARDTYGPSVARTGRVVFGTQDYRVFVAVVPSGGGPVRQLTAFQSETPSWSRDDRMIGVTYGTWRRIVDDAHYPDIAQDVGLIRADVDTPAAAPASVVRASESEDQGLDWSPNGRWIVLHSHANGLDDVWIQPANGSAPAKAITRGGSETGWPRWSPDARWIAYSTQLPEGGRMLGTLFTVGIDSATAAVTRETRRVPITGYGGSIDQVEWSRGSDSLVFIAGEGPTTRAIYIVARDGGTPRLVHRFTSEQQFSGVGVSPDTRWIAFVAPANDGHFQVFRVPIEGGTPTQVTFDPTDKTQPAVSHDGSRIAFTVFTYGMQFWMMEP
jgi:Tol biopolymer transport system component